MAKIDRFFATILISLVQIYRLLVSPLLGSHCRFYPSCSSYAQTALQTQGFTRGSWLTLYRLLRCHPFHPGGFDPVPGQSPRKRSDAVASAEQPLPRVGSH